MLTSDVRSFLNNSHKVLTLGFVELVYNEDTKQHDEKTVLKLYTHHEDLFATKSALGNCLLFSHDTILINHLYHLCQLFRYDVTFETCNRFATLELIGCDGDCRLLGGKSVFVRVNGKRPEKIF